MACGGETSSYWREKNRGTEKNQTKKVYNRYGVKEQAHSHSYNLVEREEQACETHIKIFRGEGAE